MELIPVGDNKLKIMLTLSDMTRFEIPEGAPDIPCEQIRLAFREILNEASSITGFNVSGDRLYVQYYPSKKGGCELFVTKLGRPGQNDGQSPVLPTGSTVGLAEPAVCPPKDGTDGEHRIAAYAFENVSVLLSACHRLFASGYGGDSGAWKDENGNVYLFLYGMRRLRVGQHDPYAFLSEYGTPENADSLLLYIREHAKPICETHAVETLARL